MSTKHRIEPSPRMKGAIAYGIPRAAAAIDLPLDGNEGQRPPEALLLACSALAPDMIRRYPSTASLGEMLAARHGVDPSRVTVTAGGDDALDRLMRAMLFEGREIVFPVPSFEMIERYSRLAGGTMVEVPWPSGPYPRSLVISAITEKTAVVCIVTPNNPTGTVATFEDVRAVSEAAPHAIVLLDQAYGELADGDMTQAALDLPNVVIVRSLSKAFGLAGLRIGYALGTAEIIGWLRAAGGPYAVAGPSVQLAKARLTLPQEDVNNYLARVRWERTALFSLLNELGYLALPSQANFVFARCPPLKEGGLGPLNPIALRDALARRGIGIRAFPGKRHLEDAVRITCPGDPTDYERLEKALRDATLEISQ